MYPNSCANTHQNVTIIEADAMVLNINKAQAT